MCIFSFEKTTSILHFSVIHEINDTYEQFDLFIYLHLKRVWTLAIAKYMLEARRRSLRNKESEAREAFFIAKFFLPSLKPA